MRTTVSPFLSTELENPRGFPVRAQGKNSVSYMVAGRAFRKHYGIDTAPAERYPGKMGDDILVLDLRGDYLNATDPRAGKECKYERR
jgi:hypothetical protein